MLYVFTIVTIHYLCLYEDRCSSKQGSIGIGNHLLSAYGMHLASQTKGLEQA